MGEVGRKVFGKCLSPPLFKGITFPVMQSGGSQYQETVRTPYQNFAHHNCDKCPSPFIFLGTRVAGSWQIAVIVHSYVEIPLRVRALWSAHVTTLLDTCLNKGEMQGACLERNLTDNLSWLFVYLFKCLTEMSQGRNIRGGTVQIKIKHGIRHKQNPNAKGFRRNLYI